MSDFLFTLKNARSFAPKKAAQKLINENDLKLQIASMESDIDDLEHDLEAAREKLEEMERQLDKLQSEGSSEQRLAVKAMAQRVLDLPHVTGALSNLAMLILAGDGDDDDFVILAEYHEMRKREADLNEKEGAV